MVVLCSFVLLILLTLKSVLRTQFFNNNTAQANGGALQLSTANNSIGDEIMILNSTFSGNNCTLKTCFGGAVGVDYVLDSKIKFLHIFNSSFIDNQANAGGALGILTSVGSTPMRMNHSSPCGLGIVCLIITWLDRMDQHSVFSQLHLSLNLTSLYL